MHFDPASMSPEQITAAMASLDASTDALIDNCHNLVDALPSARLVPAARAFLAAYERCADQIGDSDLDDEQVKYVRVTLGDIRRLRRALAE